MNRTCLTIALLLVLETSCDTNVTAPTDLPDAAGDTATDATTDAAMDARYDAQEDSIDCDEYIVDCFMFGYECRDETHFADMEAGWCLGPCCIDGFCEIIWQECPAGTRCYSVKKDTQWNENESNSYPCRATDCDTDAGPDCPEGSFCDTAAGVCGGPGTCLSMDEGVYLFGDENEDEFSCGCDGLTHHGGKARVHAGTALAHMGQCCDPAKLNMTAANPDKFGLWKACVSIYPRPGLSTDLVTMLEGADYGDRGDLVGCPEGEAGYVGELVVDSDGTIDAAQFDALCRLASFPGVSMVKGESDDFCDVNCFRDLHCVDTECHSACGCCPCQAGERRCTDDPATETCTPEGCWSYHFPCYEGYECVDDDEGVSCRPTT